MTIDTFDWLCVKCLSAWDIILLFIMQSEDSRGGDGLVKYLHSSCFFKSFCLTFLGEWGDRSQISALLMTTSGVIVSIILFKLY